MDPSAICKMDTAAKSFVSILRRPGLRRAKPKSDRLSFPRRRPSVRPDPKVPLACRATLLDMESLVPNRERPREPSWVSSSEIVARLVRSAGIGTTRLMRIVQLVETLETGGLERIAFELALAQKSAGHTPILYCMFQGGAFAEQARTAGIPVLEFHRRHFGRNTLQTGRTAAPRCSGRPSHPQPGRPSLWSVGRIDCPCSCRCQHAPRPINFLRPRSPRALLPGCDAADGSGGLRLRGFQAVLGGAARPSRQEGIGRRQWDRTGYFLERPAAPGTAPPRIRFGAVGRMVPVKAYAILLDAFAQIARRLPEAELRIAGGGPLEAELRERARKTGLMAASA